MNLFDALSTASQLIPSTSKSSLKTAEKLNPLDNICDSNVMIKIWGFFLSYFLHQTDQNIDSKIN